MLHQQHNDLQIKTFREVICDQPTRYLRLDSHINPSAVNLLDKGEEVYVQTKTTQRVGSANTILNLKNSVLATISAGHSRHCLQTLHLMQHLQIV